MQPPPRLEARALLLALTLGALAAASFVAAGLVRLAGDVWIPVASVTAALLLATMPLAGRVAAWARVPRGPAVAALGAAGVAPLLFLGAAYALGDPIVASHWRCGTGDAALAMLAPPAFGLLGALAGLIALVAHARAPRPAAAAARGLGLAALGLGAALVAWAGARAATRPGPDAYVASLPVVATLPPISSAPLPPADTQLMATLERVYRDRVGDLEIERRCNAHACAVHLGRPTAAPAEDIEIKRREGGSVAETAPVLLRRDEAHDLWILDVGNVVAYRGPGLELTDVHARDVARGLAPPPGWTAGAALGVLFAALLQLRRRRAAAHLAQIAAAPGGVLGDGGWIALDGGAPPVRAAPDVSLPLGPVLLLAPDARTPAGAYRGEAPLGPGAVISGERGDLVAGARDRLAAIDALALSALVLTAAPLAAAWVQLG